MKVYNAQYYAKNKERCKANMRRYNKICSDYLEQLRHAPCTDCKKMYSPWVMQFDHRDPMTKTRNISESNSIKSLNEELKKCDLVCANCHAERTYKQRELWIRRYHAA